MSDLERYARDEDRKVALAVLAGIGVLALALALTGIVVTHRVVGPAFRLRQLLRQVSEGRLRPAGSLRKHDELQDVFVMFQRMVSSLRVAREQDLLDIERAMEQARSAGMSESVLAPLREMQARIRASLE
jgi:nitrogen fixation/metabolism regulation signal transduction histidine kinase